MSDLFDNTILPELPPIHSSDGIYVRSGWKENFDFPIHHHKAYELNILINATDAQRIVGDSIMKVGDLDMVLIGSNLPHAWERGGARRSDIYEITIQFLPDIFQENYLTNFQLVNITTALRNGLRGLSFDNMAILESYQSVDEITRMSPGFERLMAFMLLINKLGGCKNAMPLASTSFAEVQPTLESRRLTKVSTYIQAHYMEELPASQLASLIGMSDSSFSRFFKTHTGCTPSEYITQIRLGAASRLLITNPNQPVLEICFACGFNNVSHFSRVFREFKGLTPTQFRARYHRKS